ncbi:hypothetical protein ABIB25_004952 [Nakamurella sp. UYEF19]|uniref:hypothetical protein n=1 Tax=Nakamurella sp. UYEF19 TaxID=1756392 RepID=UPI003394E14C
MRGVHLRVGCASVAVAILALVAGCQGSSQQQGALSLPSSSASVSASVAGSSSPAASGPTGQAAVPHGIPDSAFEHLKPFTGPAVAKYGQGSLQAAYKEMVNFAFASGWNSNLIAQNSAYLSRADAAFTLLYLTPAFKKEFLAQLGLAVQGDKSAGRRIEEAMFFGVTGSNGLKAVRSGKVVTNRRFSTGSIGLDTAHGERLSVAFAARGDIQMVDSAGRHMMLRGSRVLRYFLVANTGADRSSRPFLIDSWTIKMTVPPPTAVS